MPVDVRQFRVVGVVQGVGFRWFVRETARALDVAGWVRNESDGSVLVMAAGANEVLAQLEAALRIGPPGAHVERLEVTPGVAQPDALPRPFQVVRPERDA